MARLKIEKTSRGFGVVPFEDTAGNKCTLQKSSIATEDRIWLGCDDINLKKFTPGKGWEEIPTVDENPDGVSYIANTRMHLNQEQVAAILPYLTRFAKTGEL